MAAKWGQMKEPLMAQKTVAKTQSLGDKSRVKIVKSEGPGSRTSLVSYEMPSADDEVELLSDW